MINLDIRGKDMSNIFDDILNKYDKEHIVKLCKKLNKRLSTKSSNDLELIIELGTWMYIYKDLDNAIKVFSVTDKIKFSGNWDIWDNVYTDQILKAKIYTDMNEKSISENIKKELNKKTTYGGTLNWKSNIATHCTSSTNRSYILDIENDIKYGEGKNALNIKLWRLISLLKYLEGSVFKDDKIYLTKKSEANELIRKLDIM